jgi:hypothetical protein
MDLASPHAVVVARRDEGSFDEPVMASVPRRLERALRGRHGDAQPLVSVRAGLLVCVVAAPDAAAAAFVAERLTAAISAVLPKGRRPGAAPSAGRCGAPRRPRVVRAGARGLDLAHASRCRRRSCTPTTSPCTALLLRDRAAAEELVALVLSPLAGARGAEACSRPSRRTTPPAA